PAQVEGVMGMYPDADLDTVTQMREAAALAAASVEAGTFILGEDFSHVPATEVGEHDRQFDVADPWKVTIMAKHLQRYCDGITAAWITDAGSVEEALGFNPYLPGVF